MKTTDELFALIQAMDKNEKGYFKKFAGINGQKKNNIYLRLFDSISGMKTYNEDEVKRKFKGEKVLRHLPVSKHNLKNLLIRSLRNYHEDNLIYPRKNLAIINAWIMLDKGLYRGVIKKAVKEKETAVKNEEFTSAMEWITFCSRMRMHRIYTDLLPTAEEAIIEMRTISQKHINYHEYSYLSDTITSISHQAQGAGRTEKLKKLAQHPLLSSDKMALSARARLLYAQVLAEIYRLQNNRDKAMQIVKEYIAFLENTKSNVPERIYNQLLYFNLLLNLSDRRHTTQIAQVLDKFKKVFAANTALFTIEEKTTIPFGFGIQEIRLMLLLNKPAAALRLIEKIAPPPAGKQFKTALGTLTTMAYIELRHFDKALLHLNRILTRQDDDDNYLLIDVHVMNIIAHTELGNYSILKRQFTIAGNFIKKEALNALDEMWVIKELKEVVKYLAENNKKVVRLKAESFLQTLRSKKLAEKEYLEDWLQRKAHAD